MLEDLISNVQNNFFFLSFLTVFFNGVANNEDYVVTKNIVVRIFHHLLCVPEVTLQ
jgi:hypothetical protein